jgi:serine/threonine protein kinase
VSPPQQPTALASRYQLLEEIAQAALGVVFRCRDHHLHRDLAAKVLHEHLRDRPAAILRFLDEAQLTAQLQHPGIVPIHEQGTLPDGRPFFAMKLIRGRPLEELLRERASAREDLGRYFQVFVAICQTISYAHAHDVIHRDLKPANILVGMFGEVYVGDWGRAKVLSSSPGLVSGLDDAHEPGRVVGTPTCRRSWLAASPTSSTAEATSSAWGPSSARS